MLTVVFWGVLLLQTHFMTCLETMDSRLGVEHLVYLSFPPYQAGASFPRRTSLAENLPNIINYTTLAIELASPLIVPVY